MPSIRNAKRRKSFWRDEIIPAVEKELGIFEHEGIKPTLRSMFYRLYSKGLIPNTKSSYGSLGDYCVEARVDNVIPRDCFSDNIRQVIADFPRNYSTAEQIVNWRMQMFKKTPSSYYEQFVYKWHNQPHHVEVWLEKDAMSGTFQSILQDLHVRILPMHGYGSFTFLNETYNRLASLLREGKEIHILYYGDFDPSGEHMSGDLIRRLDEYFGLSPEQIDFERVAVNEDQITKYDLPFDPDEATAEKMDRDTRSPSFLDKYGKMYATELDALPALIPEIFRQDMVIDKVEQYFDDDIYQELLDKYSKRDIAKLMIDKVRLIANYWKDIDL